MTKNGRETLVIDESNTTGDGYGWRRLDKIETTGSVEIRVNNLRVRSISSAGPISSEGSINSGGSIIADGAISSGDWISADGDISADGYISADGWILCRVLYWGMLSPPRCTELVVTHAVRPPEWQREHWAYRLGVEIPESDCYDEIERLYSDRLSEWLARTDLLPVERLILESHTPEARAKAAVRAEELRQDVNS